MRQDRLATVRAGEQHVSAEVNRGATDGEGDAAAAIAGADRSAIAVGEVVRGQVLPHDHTSPVAIRLAAQVRSVKLTATNDTRQAPDSDAEPADRATREALACRRTLASQEHGVGLAARHL
jgi:hypothetical protein